MTATRKMWEDRATSIKSSSLSHLMTAMKYLKMCCKSLVGGVILMCVAAALWFYAMVSIGSWLTSDPALSYEAVQSQNACVKDKLHTKYINVGIAAKKSHLKSAIKVCEEEKALAIQKGETK